MTLTVESWCEALESGKYKQARGRLRADDAFCCLGVACELSDLGEWKIDEDDVPGDYGYRTGEDKYACNYNFLPHALQMELGLATNVGNFEYDSLPQELQREIAAITGQSVGALADLNDRGAAFPLIAKVIRARPKGLFREDAA